MNKQTIITALLTLVALAGQAKTYNPVSMACVNVSNGELKAREIIMRDTPLAEAITLAIAVAGIRIKKGHL